MKKLLVPVLIFVPLLGCADVIRDRIHSVQGNLIRFHHGRVAYLEQEYFSLQANDLVQVEVDESSSVTSLEKLAEDEAKSLLPEEDGPSIPMTFQPTLLEGMPEALRIYNAFNPYYKRVSECSERAHYWAHSEFKKSGTKGMKAFVFFTASYINSVRFKWWFHVAPMYKVNDNGTIRDVVMDYRYTDRPQSVKEWTDHFVYTKRPCKITDRFSEYDVNPQTENCYLMFESMHYKVPQELAAKERGKLKTQTSDGEVSASFRYAFDK